MAARATPPPHNPEWHPIPDPTALTAKAVLEAKEDMRRETDLRFQILTQRLEAMDTATKLLQDWRETLPRRLEDAMICHRDVIDQRFTTVAEQFHSVSLQFEAIQTQLSERDTRSDMMAQSGEKNIASALAAAKELLSAQNIASANAIDKNGRDTDKRIDTTVQLLQSTTAALDERIAALTEQAKTSMTRQEVEALFRSVLDKLDGPTGIAMRLENVVARGTGRADQEGRSIQHNQWIIGAVMGGMALLLTLVAIALKLH